MPFPFYRFHPVEAQKEEKSCDEKSLLTPTKNLYKKFMVDLVLENISDIFLVYRDYPG